MADSSAAQSRKRLSVRAATEPLPTPVPPPPRHSHPESRPLPSIEAHGGHVIPPDPHLVSVPSKAETENSAPEDPVPERLLLSRGVVISLAASGLLLAALGWYEFRGTVSHRLPVNSIALRHFTGLGSADDDLPYITTIPLVPAPRPLAVVGQATVVTPTRIGGIMLSEAVDETSGVDEVGEVERR